MELIIFQHFELFSFQYFFSFTQYELKVPNTKVYTTYGIHPKYIPSNLEQVSEQLQNIFKNRTSVRTETVAIGECGLAETSTSSYELQLLVFRFQVKLAAELKLPLVLHARGISAFDLMLNELKLHLNRDHKIYWHCINPKSDLNVISNLLDYFENSFVGLNCSIIPKGDLELENAFHKWLLAQENILDRTIIETDFPYLKPSILENQQYNPVSGIVVTTQHIANVLRKANINATKVIDRSNGNIRRMYNID